MVYAAAEIKIHKLLLNVAWIKKIRLYCQETTVHQRPNISKQLNGSMGRWINTVPHNKLWKAPTCRCKTIHTIKQVACVMHKRINEKTNVIYISKRQPRNYKNFVWDKHIHVQRVTELNICEPLCFLFTMNGWVTE